MSALKCNPVQVDPPDDNSLNHLQILVSGNKHLDLVCFLKFEISTPKKREILRYR